MKRYLVVLVIVLVAGAWVAGFAPEYSARHEAEAERDRLQQRVQGAEERLRVAELLGQSLALGDLIRDERFGEAQPLSSAFFDAVRAESQRVEGPGFSQALLEVLESRDATTTALSRGRGGAAERISRVQRRLRRALGYTVPAEAPSVAPEPIPAVPTGPGGDEAPLVEPPDEATLDETGADAESPTPTPTPNPRSP